MFINFFLFTISNDNHINIADDKSNEDCISAADKHCIEDAIKATGYFKIISNSCSHTLYQSARFIYCVGHGRFHFLLLLVCGFGLMCVVVENVNIGFVLPYVRCEMDISTREQGLLNSVSYIGIVISSHMWGFLADTTGRRRVLLISMTGSFTCAILSAFSFNVISLILTRLLVGIL